MHWPLKFLVISPTPTWPLDHGNRKRVHQVSSELMSAGHEVHFIYYPAEHDWAERIPREALSRMRQQWTEVHIVPPTRPLHASPASLHHSLDEWWDPALGNMLEWLFRVDRFDGMIVNYVWLSKALEFSPRQTLRIIDTHDRLGGRKELLAAQGLAPEFFYLLEDDEFTGLERADVVLAIKDEEADVFRANCADHVDVITLPYAEFGNATPLRSRNDQVVTFGLLGARNSLNRISTERLIDALLSRDDLSAANLRIIIGGAMSEDFRHLQHPCFVVLGQVDDIESFYQACDVVVVPLESSTGQKVRVGEALGMGMPMICHAHAFEGYSPAHALHILPSVEAIADAIIATSIDQSLIDSLQAATAITQDAQRSRVCAGLDRIIRHAMDRQVVTVFCIDDGLLEAKGTPWLRLTLAIKAAASCGRTVVWLELNGTPNVAGVARLRQLEQRTVLCAPSELATRLASLWIGSPRAADVLTAASFEDCLKQCGAHVIWTSTTMNIPKFSGKVVRDDELDEPDSKVSFSGQCSLMIGSRAVAGDAGTGGRRYTPFFLGQGNIPLWRAAKAGTTAWIVGNCAAPQLQRIARALRTIVDSPVMAWHNSAPPIRQADDFLEFFGRENLASRLDRPDLAVIIAPRTLTDPLPLELLAQAGTACIVLDAVNADRYRRHVFEIADEAELMSLIRLLYDAREASGRTIAFGQTLAVENFNPSSLISI